MKKVKKNQNNEKIIKKLYKDILEQKLRKY